MTTASYNAQSSRSVDEIYSGGKERQRVAAVSTIYARAAGRADRRSEQV